jgi:Rrf2 family protein
MLSSSCKYGIRAAAYLAGQGAEEDAYVPIRTISKDLAISFHFLTKILQTLSQDGILVSYRGPNGGVALARAAKAITVLEIIESIDGAHVFSACILGLRKCNEKKPCAMHATWAKERRRLADMFDKMTLERLARVQGTRL